MATIKKIKKAQYGLAGLTKGNVVSSGKTPTTPPPSTQEKMNREASDRRAAKRKEETKPTLIPSTVSKTDSLGRPAMKKGGSVKKSASKKPMMKTGGKIKSKTSKK